MFTRHRRLNRGKKGDTKGCANGLQCKWIKIKQRSKNFNVFVNHEHVLNVHMKKKVTYLFNKCYFAIFKMHKRHPELKKFFL